MRLHDVTLMGAHKFGDAPAIIGSDFEMSFTELDAAVRRLAKSLQAITQPGDRVAILAENLPEFVVSYYGVPAAGTALTFLNYRLHPREWLWILSNAEAAVLLIQARFHSQLAPLLDQVPSIHTIVVIPDGTELVGAPLAWDDFLGTPATTTQMDARTDPADIAWLIYTSGTTGFPKGAMLSHRNIVAAVTAHLVESEPASREVSLIAFPLCHVAGFTVPATHLRGGAVVLAPAFDPRGWMDLVDRFQVTNTALAPTMVDMILRHPDIDQFSLSSLERLGYGAAAMPVDTLRRAIERFGPILQSGFGMTELSGNVLIFRREDHVRAVRGEEHLLAACGQPMALADVKVVDEGFVECLPGQVGEIVVRADQVLTGYFRNPEATESSMVDGWFRTGDLARRDDEGFFYIVDRAKDMIISGGENVYSREVEEVLHQHPEIIEAAVIGLADSTWGEVVTAVVVTTSGAQITEDEIIDFCRDHMAGFKRPRQVFFVDALPRTASGKALKRDLREQFAKSKGAL
jgi:acyl-CoA synthetase (AMP-forming)/AMP-acid ligase II